jgi:protein-S-isoprenylcysteine O-methyltransferase Ste14
MMTSGVGRSVALAAILIERFGLPPLFFYYAVEHWRWITTTGTSEYALIQIYPFIEISRQVVWMLYEIFIGLMLLFGRRVMIPPRNVKDFVVPLATTFFYFAYEASYWFPAGLSANRFPIAWQNSSVTTALLLNLAGLSVELWALLSLGRSFGVLVEVRKVVVEGAYRWIRHPIYLGSIIFIMGFAAANGSIAYFILVPVHIALIVYRARLEEGRLAESSPEYGEYRKRTGFMFPKFRRVRVE